MSFRIHSKSNGKTKARESRTRYVITCTIRGSIMTASYYRMKRKKNKKKKKKRRKIEIANLNKMGGKKVCIRWLCVCL